MQVVERVITSARPEVVWQILADVEHWRDWTPTVTEIKPVGSTGMKPGARYRVMQPKLRPAIYEVTNYVPGQRFTWEQKLPGGALIADHQIVPSGAGSEVELSFTSRGLLADIAAALFAKTIAQYVATEAHSLKTYSDKVSHQRAS